jgi:hypothetical protein
MDDCFQSGGRKEGQYPAQWRGKRSAPSASANFMTTVDRNIKSSEHYALSALIIPDNIKDILKENKCSLRKVALAAGNLPESMSSCSFADSGCMIHFFKNRDVFLFYKPLNQVVSQSSKEGTSFTILGTGDIEFKVIFQGTKHTLTFHNALHAPNITANLLSISKMDLAGWSAIFRNGHVWFLNQQKSEVFYLVAQ